MLADRVRMRSSFDDAPIIYDNGANADALNPFTLTGTVDIKKESNHLYIKNTVAGGFEAGFITKEKVNFSGYTKLLMDFESDKSFSRRTLELDITNYQGEYFVRFNALIGPPTTWNEEAHLIITNDETPADRHTRIASARAFGGNSRYDMLTFKVYKIWLE